MLQSLNILLSPFKVCHIGNGCHIGTTYWNKVGMPSAEVGLVYQDLVYKGHTVSEFDIVIGMITGLVNLDPLSFI